MEQNFCRGWLFSKDSQSPIPVNLPHDAMLSEERTSHCHNGDKTGYFPGGKYCYEKELVLTEQEAAGYVALHFGGVYRHATVLLNEQVVAEHLYGYTEFMVELSPMAVKGTNKIKVLVDNSLEPNSRWYTGSGIYRPVTLITKSLNHIRDLRVKTVSCDPAVVEVICDDSQAHIEILDGENVIASGVPGRISVPGARLWSAEAPYLYTCRAVSSKDSMEVAFGIRSLSFSAETGFCVNGEQVLLRGGCIHHDNGILGACSFADAEERRVRILKECGYNAIRSAHNPCSKELLDACDRLGMYVLDEAYDGWYITKTHHDVSRTFWQEYQEDLTAMVYRDYNHPCVVMYSIGNEVSEVGQDEGVALAREMVSLLHQLDETRPVTCGINAMLTVWAGKGLGIYKDTEEYRSIPLPEEKIAAPSSGSALFNALSMRLGKLLDFQTAGKAADKALAGISDELDILGLNYGHYRYDKELKQHPDRLLLGTETRIDTLPYNWKRVKENKALLGDFCWTAFDYLGEAGIGHWAYPDEKGLPLLAGCGAIDILGCPDVMNSFQQIIWGLRKEPVIAVQPLNHGRKKPLRKAWRFTNAIESWTWPGYEGAAAIVEVYSDAAAIELRCNKSKIARKKVKDFCAAFHTKYMPGRLEAIAYDATGKECGRSRLVTGNRPDIQVKVEKKELRANGQDLCYVMMELADKDGILTPLDGISVHVDVKGAAVLQAMGSARCITDENYHMNECTTYRGRCLAIVRAGYEPGEAEISISAAGYSQKKVPITIV